MVDEFELKSIIANNIVTQRKALNLTQAELAEKLNYSDKAVSKWERAEAIPDIFILKQLAELFGITLDDLTKKHTKKQKITYKRFVHKKTIIPLLSAVLVWLIATICYALFMFFKLPINCDLCFIYAIPLSCIVLFIFSVLWFHPLFRFFTLTGITWSIALAFFLTFNIDYNYLFFIIAIPVQILISLWLVMRSPKRPTTKK